MSGPTLSGKEFDMAEFTRIANAVAAGSTTVAQAANALGGMALAWNMSPMRAAFRQADDDWRRLPWWRKAALYAMDGGGARDAWKRRRLCELIAPTAAPGLVNGGPPPDELGR